MDSLTEIIKRLKEGRVEFVLIGGLAAVKHGSSYLTFDADVCVPPDPDNFKRIGTALADFHPRFRLRKDLPFELTDDLVRGLKNLYLHTDCGPLDCLTEVAGVGDYTAALEQSVPGDFTFGRCPVLRIDALIRSKETMGRPKDLLVVTQLRAIEERQSSKT